MSEDELLKQCAMMFPWLLDWAEAWRRQAGGYAATDTVNGLLKCVRLKAELERWEKSANPGGEHER